jgi:hypothetical protein
MFIAGGILALASPTVAYGSDMTGAIGYVLGWFVLLLLGAGAITAVVLRFAFKRGKRVWLLVPALPALGIGCFIAFILFRPQPKNFKEGPEFPTNGGPTADVSPDFGKSDLTRLYSIINSSEFRAQLASITHKPASEYMFSVTLTVPPEREARHYVALYTHPEVNTGGSAYGQMADLFTYVVQTGACPSNTVSSAQTTQ